MLFRVKLHYSGNPNVQSMDLFFDSEQAFKEGFVIPFNATIDKAKSYTFDFDRVAKGTTIYTRNLCFMQWEKLSDPA